MPRRTDYGKLPSVCRYGNSQLWPLPLRTDPPYITPSYTHHYLARYGIHCDDPDYGAAFNCAEAGIDSLGMRHGFREILRKKGIQVADWDATVRNRRGLDDFKKFLREMVEQLGGGMEYEKAIMVLRAGENLNREDKSK